MLIDGLEWCGLLWCFYQLFGRHPFTPLVNKWWCNATFLKICSDKEMNSSTSWMTREWINVPFWANCSFKAQFTLVSYYKATVRWVSLRDSLLFLFWCCKCQRSDGLVDHSRPAPDRSVWVSPAVRLSQLCSSHTPGSPSPSPPSPAARTLQKRNKTAE